MSNYSDYRVYGDMVHKYYVDVAAPNEEVAWEAARQIPTNGWSEVVTDEVIDPYRVEHLKDL